MLANTWPCPVEHQYILTQCIKFVVVRLTRKAGIVWTNPFNITRCTMQFYRHIVKLAFHDTPEFLVTKWDDSRRFTAALLFVAGVAGPLLWGVDVLTDNDGSRHTLLLRLFYASFALFGLVLTRMRNPSSAAMATITSLLFAEVIFIAIMNRLDVRLTYGVGEFCYFMLLGIILLPGFSLRWNITYSVLAVVLPHILGIVGFAQDFRHMEYATIVWPSCAIAVLAQTVLAYNYAQRSVAELERDRDANTDPMTGLTNRRNFMPLLRQEILRARRFGHVLTLLVFDIDRLQEINEEYGTQTGDLLLCKFADVCIKELRSIDLVARLDGEEFAAILPETNLLGAQGVAERIRRHVAGLKIRSLDGRHFQFTVSIGVVALRPEHTTEDTMVVEADNLVKDAKLAGRNQVRSSAPVQPPATDLNLILNPKMESQA